MENAFFAADKKRDIKSMRAELHKMSPIVSNLKYAELYALFEKYRVFEGYDDSLSELNRELKSHLSTIYRFLH
ncbi:MAG: hypothetical protein JSS79_20550 [Bacteroidetes bacterium]|nr:hypothetical protein [Bacteroidota bacterium]